MAYFHTTVLDEQIKALPTVDTASGSIATFDTDMTENLVEVKCQILAKQEGSGTPSPSNPRPITTYTSLNLSHSGADTSNPTVYNIPFGQTVANGVLDVTTGKLEITHQIVVCDGTENWSEFSSGKYFAPVITPNTNKVNGTGYITNIYAFNGNGNTQSAGITIDSSAYMQASYGRVWIYDSNITSLANLQTLLSNTNLQVVYPLASPIEIQLDSITLQALLNENNVWCDTGDTEVKYLLTVGKKIS